MNKLPLKQKIFFTSIYILTLLVLIYASTAANILLRVQDYLVLIFFIAVTGLTESITLCFNKISFSTTFAVTLATYVLFGPFEALLISIGGFLIRVLKIDNDTYRHLFNTPWYGTLFNCSMYSISLLTAHYIVDYILGRFSYTASKLVISVILFSIIYAIINKMIVASMMKIYTGQSLIYCFMKDIKLALLNYIIMIPFGVILVHLYTQYSYWGIIFILFPVLLVKYTFTYYADSQSQFIQTVESLMNAIEARDNYTEGHSHRVAEVAAILAERMGFNEWKIEKLRIGAMLHDVGKIGISDAILNKPGQLTEEEFTIIKSHPIIGEGIIKGIKNFDDIRMIVRHHHERFDGKGYPDGKKGDELPLEVYIIQIADAIDAMASDRPYRKGLPKDVIIKIIEENMGSQFHPNVARAYLEIAQDSTKLDQIWE